MFLYGSQASYRHYRKPDICRVLKTLPRAIYRALGKGTICRVPTERHSATKRHSAKICFAECHAGSTRHTASRVRCIRSPRPLPVTAVIVCRVSARGHSANTSLPSATQLALGKDYHVTRPLPIATNVTVIVCRVPGCGTRQRFINAECNYNGTRHSDSLPVSSLALGETTKKISPTQSKLFP